MPVHRGVEVAQEALTRSGRYQEVAESLQVKEVIVGDGERRRRYVVCYNRRRPSGRPSHEVLQRGVAGVARGQRCVPVCEAG